MQLYLIRHAQSANNHLWDVTGSSKGRNEDPDLTQHGQMQAEYLGRFYREVFHQRQSHRGVETFTHLYTSLMQRAVKTAWMVAQAVGCDLEAWVDFHECGGIYLEETEGNPLGLPGKPRSFFEQNFPNLKLPETLTEAGWWNRPFEALEARRPRAERVFAELMQRHGNTPDRVAVVTHGAFYHQLLGVILGLPESQANWFLMNNVGITRIDFYPEFTNVAFLNRVDFLPDTLIT